MNTHEFVKLSTTVCRDLRHWVEEARRQAVVSEGQLLALTDAAEVIDQGTRAFVANQPDTATNLEAQPATGDQKLEGRSADAADEAGSAFLPRDKVLPDPTTKR